MRSRRVPALATSVLLSWAAAGYAAVPTGFQDQLVLGSLNQPTAFEFLPDGRILYLEKVAGNVRLVVNGAVSPAAVLTLADLNASGNERGLLGLAVDPGWPVRPYVYLHYSRVTSTTMVIVRYTASGDLSNGSSASLLLGSPFDILNDIPDVNSNHNGGTLRFGPDGMLYASVGEDAVHCAAQDSTDVRGTILRLDVSGLPSTGSGPPAKSAITPPDNPFPPVDPELGLVFCYGLRNPFRFQIDPTNGHLLIADVGAQSYEELNEAVGGENFGWPFREGPIVITPPGCAEPGGAGTRTYDGFIATYDRTSMPSASIIAGPRYWRTGAGAGEFPPEYHGAVFFSDFYGGFIRVIRNFGGVWSPLDSVPGQPNATDWANGITGIVDYRVGPEGALYYSRLFPGSLRRIVYTGGVTGLPDGGSAPGPALHVRPNPARAGSSLRLELSPGGAGGGEAIIVSVTGRILRRLAPSSGGSGTAWLWDGRDAGGRIAPAGVYAARVRTGSGERARKFVLLP